MRSFKIDAIDMDVYKNIFDLKNMTFNTPMVKLPMVAYMEVVDYDDEPSKEEIIDVVKCFLESPASSDVCTSTSSETEIENLKRNFQTLKNKYYAFKSNA